MLLDDDDAGSLLGGLGGRSVELQERVHLHLEQSPLGLCGGGGWRRLSLAVTDERVALQVADCLHDRLQVLARCACHVNSVTQSPAS